MASLVVSPFSMARKSGDSVVPGDHLDLEINLDLQISGTLELSAMDRLMNIKSKTIYGDGHSHEVMLSTKVWEKLMTGKSIAVRSGVDSDKGMHGHWVKVLLG